jgi:hypothetical protein
MGRRFPRSELILLLPKVGMFCLPSRLPRKTEDKRERIMRPFLLRCRSQATTIGWTLRTAPKAAKTKAIHEDQKLLISGALPLARD